MTRVGELIYLNGRAERVIEAQMIYDAEGKPFYVALRTEPVEKPDGQTTGTQPAP